MTGPLIYLHGFASSPASRKARYFQDRFTAAGIHAEVPALDEAGFENLTISGQLDVIERVAAGRPATLMGSSMGGYLAALYAARHPEIERLILLAPAFDFAPRWAARLGETAMSGWRETGFLEVFHYAGHTNSRVGWQLIEDALQFESYPAVSQPTLIFHGLSDDVVPAEVSEHFAKVHPFASLTLVQSGHELLDVLPLMWQSILEFLGLYIEPSLCNDCDHLDQTG